MICFDVSINKKRLRKWCSGLFIQITQSIVVWSYDLLLKHLHYVQL